VIAGLLALLAGPLVAEGAEVGGYVRVAARPDLQGGQGQLGYWNLYGRLLNEGSWVALGFRQELLERTPGREWAAFNLRVEGQSLGTGGYYSSISQLGFSQINVEGGVPALPNVTWRVGTLNTWMGDLGLYDMRPAALFDHTIGTSARIRRDRWEVLVGAGDSGLGLKGWAYHVVGTVGAQARFSPGERLHLGLGGQFLHEPKGEGNPVAAHRTPGIEYEPWIRGDVLDDFLASGDVDVTNFPDPVAIAANSWRVVGSLEFGDLGPLRWNSLFARVERLHPDVNPQTPSASGQKVYLYPTSLTDERDVFLIGNEMQVTLWPERLDGVWSVLGGVHLDGDNDVVPTDDARSYLSTVIRLQAYLTPSVHLLLESSAAEERSRNGTTWRNHADSVFETSDGIVQDTNGLLYGDSDKRQTWQGKGGIVFNPLGRGIYSRPSLRLLYGAQFSTENMAYGSGQSQLEMFGLVASARDQYSDFPTLESHWHHILAIETEAWF
jgi:hypothetical protein